LRREGTTVDTILIVAPSSTKNREGQRDPIGVDDQSGLVYTVIGTTAKVSDMSPFS
jgi:IS5 family transposase